MPDSASTQEPIEFSQIGPDMGGNVHLHRPYFLLPISAGIEAPIGMSPASAGGERRRLSLEEYRQRVDRAQKLAVARIKGALVQTEANITDVYVLSHGWHRNYFSAVSSYDRLATRIASLLSRGRLPVCPGYKPLFICVQWSSEIGEDGWVDKAGRRDKPSYIDKAKKYFDDTTPDFINTMEDVFELFSAMSAPDTDSLAPGLLANSKLLAGKLAKQELLCKPPEIAADSSGTELQALKVCAAWTAYQEADARGVKSEQTTRPRGFATTGQRLIITAKFILGAVGAMGLLTFLFPRLGGVFHWIGDTFTSLWRLIPNVVRDPLDKGWLDLSAWWRGLEHQYPPFLIYFVLTVIAAALSQWILTGLANQAEKRRVEGKPSEDPGWLIAVPFIIAQLIFALPLLVVVIFAFLAGQLSKSLPTWLGLSREKGEPRRFAVLSALSNFARNPGRAVARATSVGTPISGIAAAAESQLAFYSMQQRGVDAGREAAKAILELLGDVPLLNHARLHFLGHSFGGIVVNNAARELVSLVPDLRKFRGGRGIETLCTIEGAYSSGWFATEAQLTSQMDRTLASIYSSYDSATGFYYPFSNAGRFAAGSVGLSMVQLTPKPEDKTLRPANPWKRQHKSFDPPRRYCPWDCKEAHIHHPLAFASLADPPWLPGGSDFAAINLDGSRMIYEGPVASGGGHTDIYKDDVVHLMWAAAHRADVISKKESDPKRVEVEDEVDGE